MTGLSEQAKELHMMMGRRKPPKIQAVLNTRYWKNTEKTIKRTVGMNIHTLSQWCGEQYEKMFISKVAEVYMLHHTAAILRRKGVYVDVFKIPSKIMNPPEARANCTGCPSSQNVSPFFAYSEPNTIKISESIRINHSYTLVPTYIRKKVSSLMGDSELRYVYSFSGSLYSYLLEKHPLSEVKKLMEDLPSTEDENFRRNETGSEHLKKILGVKTRVSELFISQFSLLFRFLHTKEYVRDVIFKPVENDMSLSEELAHVLFFTLLHSDIMSRFSLRELFFRIESGRDNNKKRDLIREYVSDVTKEYSLCIPGVVSRHDKK
ncbi:hypothetical protein RCO15_14340 [Escherichia coli]|nr:hypothetical protein [Escherichia marmotae]EGA1366646.1 hypothetical protein [Escherichia coli]EGM8190884.1 hypothetical protein [Escherichia coli]EHT4165252.1 hypothetical protein [Escherichia coli]MEC9680081.1 hypothetical protein [Escherichia coli]MED0011947.1 hypothetical protein [Escherichia coli]